jgi:ribonuclease HII
MVFPTLDYEIELWEKGFLVIGVDEVGRGAFAGPLFAAGVIFPPTKNQKLITKLLSFGINDSKKLTAPKREMLDKIIRKEALAYSISSIDVAEINRIGIGKANFKAMRQVVTNLREWLMVNGQWLKPYVLIDGFHIKNLKGVGLKNQKAIIGGDGISLSIAAASIIAKVARDKYMRDLSEQYSEFGWDENKGYGTLAHRNVLRLNGPTVHHRTQFIAGSI